MYSTEFVEVGRLDPQVRVHQRIDAPLWCCSFWERSVCRSTGLQFSEDDVVFPLSVEFLTVVRDEFALPCPALHALRVAHAA